MLTSATVAVYRDADSSLLQFTLPNNMGEFTIKSLPFEVRLHLILTHVGYKPLYKGFVLDKNKSIIDLGLLYMHQHTDANDNILEEVVVKARTPMRMNGDTLEFNADAFKMDPNATAEDLMRRLPGITIWSDGDITFNGKKINAVLVEGKPFMGSSDITIATQNLPKDALDKIQIYQQRNEKNPLDSIMFANIKLKADKKTGYFGKVSAGYGLSGSPGKDKPYAADGMLSAFNRKMQIVTVAGGNNVNKLAHDVDALLRNSSFKGEGASMEYQSDFSLQGINQPVMGGARLQYDFIPDVLYQQTSRLNADYFIRQNNKNIIHTNLEKNFITSDTVLSRFSNSTVVNNAHAQRVNTRYERNTGGVVLNFDASASMDKEENLNMHNSSQEKTSVGNINNYSATSQSNNAAKNIQTGFSFSLPGLNKPGGGRRRIPTAVTVGYRLNASDNKGNSKSQTLYEFANEPKRNRNVSRLYDRLNANSTGHNFNFNYPQLKQLLFGEKNLGGVNIGLSATYHLHLNGNNEDVRDLDTSTNTYRTNSSLSHLRNATTKDFMPVLSLSKYFYKGLTNRYNKILSLNFNAMQQYYSYNSQSTQRIQNLGYYYHKFVPNAALEYTIHQYGSYETHYSLNYSSNAAYPDVNLLAPLADSANPLYLPIGNRHLKPSYHQKFELRYKFATRTPKNPLNIDAGIFIGKKTAHITDSTIYDNEGGRTVFMINIEGHRYLNNDINIRKSVEVNKKNTLEFSVLFNNGLSNDPRYIDTRLNTSVNRFHSGKLHINFRHTDILTLKLEQGYGFSEAEQRGFNSSRFKSNYQYSRGVATLQFPKNLTWNTNLTYNRNEADNNEAISFAIWNASITYRLFRGNNGEVKFTSLDLLRQNKGVTVNASGNSQNFGYTNVLQQYFMLTLAYYPRKFGK